MNAMAFAVTQPNRVPIAAGTGFFIEVTIRHVASVEQIKARATHGGQKTSF